MRNIKQLLGKRIKEIRKKRGFTQEKLAELADIEIPSLSNIENGKNYPSHETLDKISCSLGVMPYELYMFDYYISQEEMIENMNKKMQSNKELTQKLYQFFLCIK